MLEKIIVSTDLSESSSSLIECLCALPAIGAKDIVLMHVIELKYSLYVPPEMESLLEKQAEVLRKVGLNVTTDLKTGVPWAEIGKAAKTHNATMIIAGSHGKSIMKEIVLGSVTAELLEHIDIPVLVLRMDPHHELGKQRACNANISKLFSNVLFASDFSSETSGAKDRVREVAHIVDHATFIHVQEPILIEQAIEFDQREMDDIDIKHLNDIAGELGVKGFKTKILHGKAAVEISDFANSEKFSLIVMGARGLGMAASILLGSTSRYVIRHSNAPVLVIPNLAKA